MIDIQQFCDRKRDEEKTEDEGGHPTLTRLVFKTVVGEGELEEVLAHV